MENVNKSYMDLLHWSINILLELYAQGAYTEVRDKARALLQAAPFSVEGQYLYLASLVRLGEYTEAKQELQTLRAMAPDFLGAFIQEIYIEKGEGKTQSEWEHLQAFLHRVEKELVKDPENHRTLHFAAEAHSLLGSAWTLMGQAEQAVPNFLAASHLEVTREQKAVELSNALFAVNYLPMAKRAPYQHAHQEYQALFADIALLSCAADKQRDHEKLRIGYISPDLRYHAVAAFFLPLLRAHDTSQFEIYAYANNAEDHISAQIKNLVSHWRNILGKSAVDAARLVRQDEIDILFDLSGHTAYNALPILAYKPAPIQITGIGYFATTGLKAIDYVLSDPWLDPHGVAQGFTEKPLCLSKSHFCFTPLIAMPDILPWQDREELTFVSFNNFSKATDEVLLSWSEILQRVPQARLYLKSKLFGSAEGLEIAKQRLQKANIDPQRVRLEGLSSDYIQHYCETDIALDTFPYPGGMTTCEALYMGIPVVTMAGQVHGARFGESLLQNVGLPQLIAHTPEEYVSLTVALAENKKVRRNLHETLRARMQASPLMDAQNYAKEIENAYRKLWRHYVAQN